MNSRFNSLLVITLLALTVSACKPKYIIGTEQTFAIDLPPSESGNATAVTLEMAVPQGTLALTGGTEDLIQGTIIYNAAEYEPEMTKSDEALLIRQREPGPKSVVVSVQNDLINRWDLHLGETPMKFAIHLENGEYTMEFDQSLPADFNATVNAGVGKVNLIIDPEMSTQIIIGEHTDLLKITTRGDWAQTGNIYETGAGSASLTITVNMRGGELNLDNK